MLHLLQELSNYLSEPKAFFPQHLRNVSVLLFFCELCAVLIFYA